jgi:hypothetical protein
MSGGSGMGWRDVLAGLIGFTTGPSLPYRRETVECALLAMPAPARIALARELLAGTGRVVARDVEEYGPEYDDATRGGWNACRAAMMEDGE